MTARIRSLNPVISAVEQDFGGALDKVLSPSSPLQSEEFLRGRHEHLVGIRRSLYSSGRHIFIHGFRGVGKSSLAQTAAFSTSSGGKDPILLGCDENSSFVGIVRDMFEEALAIDPSIKKIIDESSSGMDFKIFSFGGGKITEQGRIEHPNSINEAVRLTELLCQNHTDKPVIVIDEFDQMKDTNEQQKFANFIKQISDKHVPARFIFCGIGESVDALMAAHGSIDRYFHTVALGRLEYEARFEIVRYAAEQLGIEIDDTTVYRIAKISDGFPHYVHLISEKLFWRVYSAKNEGKVTGELFEMAMVDASDAMEMKLKQPYETATRKYTNDYEPILFSAADGHELQRRSSDIYESYRRIMKSLGKNPLDRNKFNSRMNRLKTPAYASMLTASRAGWYEFTEKVIRGYARLRAEQAGVELEVDHPLATKKFGRRLADDE